MEYEMAEKMDSLITTLDGSLKGYKEYLKLNSSGDLATIYSPFDFINSDARIVIAGLTPGEYQAEAALKKYRTSRMQGSTVAVALKLAKNTASFSGPMRSALIKMMDSIGLNEKMGINSCSELFGEKANLVHWTSVLRYPVFKAGKNYSGSPSPTSAAFLSSQLDEHLAEELNILQEALWIPLGKGATDSLNRAVSLGKLAEENLLSGLPHPSGANAERIAYFLGREDKSELSIKTNALAIDQRKNLMQQKIASWKFGATQSESEK